MSTPAARVANVINVTELVDNARFSPLHWRAFALCMACLLMDGFDVQVLGYTAPSIIREWRIANAAALARRRVSHSRWRLSFAEREEIFAGVWDTR